MSTASSVDLNKLYTLRNAVLNGYGGRALYIDPVKLSFLC